MTSVANTNSNSPTYLDVRGAAERIRGWVHSTPVLTSRSLDALSGGKLYFKCENFQRTGSFKMRGASNAILQIPDELVKSGVATHSSGNHAAALACAAQRHGVPAYVVMPHNAPLAKREMAIGFGATIELCEPTMASREETLRRILDANGATLVHPYNDSFVIAGQGTATLELLDEVCGLDTIVAPISGGGLLSGTAIAAKGIDSTIQVYGAEPEMADDAARSFRSRQLEPLLTSDTIADGLRANVCQRTLDIVLEHVADIQTVTEAQIANATKLIWRYLKIVVEPSGAVPLALILSRREQFQNHRIGLILSGGNLDLDQFFNG